MVTIYHNPRCSKSRNALALLRDNGVEPTIIEYLKTPPDGAQLADILTKLNLRPRDMMRRKEVLYRDLNLDDDSVSDDQLCAAMVANPILIERPIVLIGDRGIIGRPPEDVLTIL
jgi:arsenate reductase